MPIIIRAHVPSNICELLVGIIILFYKYVDFCEISLNNIQWARNSRLFVAASNGIGNPTTISLCLMYDTLLLVKH